MACDWSNLSNDLMEAIVKRLRVEDYLRVQAVCKSWQTMLKERRPVQHQPHHQLPWLMMPEVDSDTCPFYSFTDNKIHHIHLPELRGKRCCGSSFGWMAVVDKTPNVFLLNPLTKSQIQLPPITTFPEVVDFCHEREQYHYNNTVLGPMIYDGQLMKGSFLSKVILSESPSSTHNRGFIVMAIYGDLRQLAFCRQGDDKWTLVHHCEHLYMVDVLHWKGNFYAVDCHGRLVMCCDLEGPFPKIMRMTVGLRRPDMNYLVVGREEELFVFCKNPVPYLRQSLSWADGICSKANIPTYYDVDDPSMTYSYNTRGYLPYKLDEDRRKWFMANLPGDHNQMWFVGKNFALSLYGHDFPECKANCLYFTDDDLNGTKIPFFRNKEKFFIGGHHIGAYDRQGGNVRRFRFRTETTKGLIRPSPFWATLCPY